MTEDKRILCGASSYKELFYFNPEFDSLPDAVKDELRIMCVLFTSDVGGILRLEFDASGNLNFAVESREDDFLTFKDGYMVNVNKAFDAFIQKHLDLCAPGKYFSIEYNPDGKRKPLSQILSEMGQLDESPKSDDLRSVYKYIIQERSLKK